MTDRRYIVPVVAHRLFGWRIEGTENVPETGGFIIAANHVSYADPPLIGAAAPRRPALMALMAASMSDSGSPSWLVTVPLRMPS